LRKSRVPPSHTPLRARCCCVCRKGETHSLVCVCVVRGGCETHSSGCCAVCRCVCAANASASTHI
jgi:hypothetical protein